MRTAFLDTLPRGSTLDEQDWRRRHRLALGLLIGHIPALAVVAGLSGRGIGPLLAALAGPAVCMLLGHLLRRHRRLAAVSVTLGLVSCSTALVGLTGGAIEAHFHFFVIIGFIALYQDWVPFLFMILFTTAAHALGSTWQQDLIFNHPAAQASPWLWSLLHGVAVLFACAGTVLFWHVTEDAQEKSELAGRLSEAELGKRTFAHDLLVNLARRNQSMLYRQLEIINQLEESERDPDTLAQLFTLDHLATRVRRNAESLLVLSGEQPSRTWSQPVPLRDVLRAAIAETEDLERVVFAADEEPAVAGHTVTDLTHLIAELTENAVRFSPPDSTVSIRARPDQRGGYTVTVEDWGIGMPPADLDAANALLAAPPEVDLSVSARLGFHVVARLAARHRVQVALSATPNSGITATIALPARLFTGEEREVTEPFPAQSPSGAAAPATAAGEKGADHETPDQVASHIGFLAVESVTADSSPAVDSPATGFPAVRFPAVRIPAVGFPAVRMSEENAAAYAASASGAGDRNGVERAGHGHPLRPTATEPMGGMPEQRWLGWWAADIDAGRTGIDAAVPTPTFGPRHGEPDGGSGSARHAAGSNGSGQNGHGFDHGPDANGGTRPDLAARTAAPEPVPTRTPAEPVPTEPFPAPFDTPARLAGTTGPSAPDGGDPVPIASPADPRSGSPAADAARASSATHPDQVGGPGQDGPAVPSPRPRSATAQLPPQPDRRAATSTGDAPVDPVSGLRRRVPQAHLVPELRGTPSAADTVGSRLSEHATDAADALSRYQASRQAARTAVEDGQRWSS